MPVLAVDTPAPRVPISSSTLYVTYGGMAGLVVLVFRMSCCEFGQWHLRPRVSQRSLRHLCDHCGQRLLNRRGRKENPQRSLRRSAGKSCVENYPIERAKLLLLSGLCVTSAISAVKGFNRRTSPLHCTTIFPTSFAELTPFSTSSGMSPGESGWNSKS